MYCIHCGAANPDAAIYCTRCSARMAPPRAAAAASVRPLPTPLLAALHGALPSPLAGSRVTAFRPQALFPGSSVRPVGIVRGSAAQPLHVVAGASHAANDDRTAINAVVAPRPSPVPGWLPWLAGAVAVAVAAAWAASRWMGPANEPTDDSQDAGMAKTTTPSGAPAPAASPLRSGAELTEAINAGLRRLGIANARVHVAADGTATVSGTAASPEDRDALLRMIADVNGVTAVRNALQVLPPVAPPPLPAPPAPPPMAAAPIAPPVVQAPVAPPVAMPRPAPPPVERPPRVAAAPMATAPPPVIAPAPRPPAPPVVEAAVPVPPDPAQVSRAVRRALDQLALAGVTPQVDDSLTVTLRGTVNDPAKKAQALAAARAASPHGKVRDLIFVVEE